MEVKSNLPPELIIDSDEELDNDGQEYFDQSDDDF
jgi:hypothetical protein